MMMSFDLTSGESGAKLQCRKGHRYDDKGTIEGRDYFVLKLVCKYGIAGNKDISTSTTTAAAAAAAAAAINNTTYQYNHFNNYLYYNFNNTITITTTTNVTSTTVAATIMYIITTTTNTTYTIITTAITTTEQLPLASCNNHLYTTSFGIIMKQCTLSVLPEQLMNH